MVRNKTVRKWIEDEKTIEDNQNNQHKSFNKVKSRLQNKILQKHFEPFELHYLKQGLHLHIEEKDKLDVKQILQVLYTCDDKYVKKFIINHIRKTTPAFSWNVSKLDLYKNIEKEINETFR